MSGDYITEFMEDYTERCRDRGEAPLSEAVLRPILEDFVLAEGWHLDDPTRLDVAIRSLTRLLADQAKALAIVAAIGKEASALRARLDRQSRTNEIMQEHLVMLSDQLSQNDQ